MKPIILNRADPCAYRHTDGWYYFTATVPEYDRIELRRSATLAGLAEAPQLVIWRKRESGPMSANVWAPEISYLAGKWYIHFAAARTSETKDGLYDHRIFVLECGSQDPFSGAWIEKGQLRTGRESFCLDATVATIGGSYYLVWAQKDPGIPGNSNLYISRLKNPWTLEGDAVLLSRPEFDWETIGFLVNEGPSFLSQNGRMYITYSASATDHHYCVGLLNADAAANPLDPRSWRKSPTPILRTDESEGVYGPGHGCFTVSETGEDFFIFHARTYREIDGDPLDDPNRHTYACPVSAAEGTGLAFALNRERSIR